MIIIDVVTWKEQDMKRSSRPFEDTFLFAYIW
jgi:hypothetical protein